MPRFGGLYRGKVCFAFPQTLLNPVATWLRMRHEKWVRTAHTQRAAPEFRLSLREKFCLK